MNKYFCALLFFMVMFSVTPLYAGGGRYRIESYNSPGFTGNNYGVNVQVWITNAPQTQMTVGERAEFRIRNPRPGDRCETPSPVSGETGQIFGKCFAEEPGNYPVYVYSFSNNEESSDYYIYFNAAPTNTPVPTKAVKPTRTNVPTIQKDVSADTVDTDSTEYPIPTAEVDNQDPEIIREGNILVKILYDLDKFFEGLFKKLQSLFTTQ